MKSWIDDGNGPSEIASALQFVADKFSWNLDLAEVAAGTSKFFDAMKVAGKGLVGLGSSSAGSISHRASKTVIRSGWRTARSAEALPLPRPLPRRRAWVCPWRAAIGGAGLLWGLASMASGIFRSPSESGTLVRERSAGVKDLATAVAGGVKDAVGWVGGRLGFG